MEKYEYPPNDFKGPVFRMAERPCTLLLMDKEAELISDPMVSYRKDLLTTTATVITLSVGAMYALKNTPKLAVNFILPIGLTVAFQFSYGLGERYRGRSLFQAKAQRNYQRDNDPKYKTKEKEWQAYWLDYFTDSSGNIEFAFAFFKITDFLFVGSYMSLAAVTIFTLGLLGFRRLCWIFAGLIAVATIKVIVDVMTWCVRDEPQLYMAPLPLSRSLGFLYPWIYRLRSKRRDRMKREKDLRL